MLLLALDTSLACSVAVASSEQTLAFRRDESRGGMADRLVDLIDRTVADARVGYGDLSAIAVTRGPGGFTSVRSAVAAARALALATSRPVLGLSTLEALARAAGAPAGGVVVAAIDARREQVYAQTFDLHLDPLGPPQAVAPSRAVEPTPGQRLRLVGSGAAEIRAALPNGVDTEVVTVDLDARIVAAVALDRMRHGAVPTAGHTLQPLYLRPPDARPQSPPMPKVQAARA